MGGRGRKSDRTVRLVRASSRVACRKIRMHNPGSNAEPAGRSHRTDRQEKPLGSETGVRTKTDTGGWGEYPKALERTAVKELGKLDP
jgi:hypothetical protein